MKYVCIGYYSEENWNAMSEDEQKACMEECFAYDVNEHFKRAAYLTFS